MSSSPDIWAVVPIKELDGAKQRLAPLLSPAQRRALIEVMMGEVLQAVAGAKSLAGLMVVTLDPQATALASRLAAVAGAYKASKCGNLWDALKWEYRLETAYTGYGMWYFAGRGWGDLPQGTALYWPVPYQEMDTRRQAFYSSGGVGGTGSAPNGNYGLFAGGVY